MLSCTNDMTSAYCKTKGWLIHERSNANKFHSIQLFYYSFSFGYLRPRQVKIETMEEIQYEYLKRNHPDRHNNWQLTDTIWYLSSSITGCHSFITLRKATSLSKVMEVIQSVDWPTKIISEILQRNASGMLPVGTKCVKSTKKAVLT